MTYYENTTIIDDMPLELRKNPEIVKIAYKRFAKNNLLQCHSPIEELAVMLAVDAEQEWVKHNKPFFVIKPKLIDSLSHTNLNISIKHLENTHNPIAINLPQNNGLDVIWENDIFEIKSILIHKTKIEHKLRLVFSVKIGNKNKKCNRLFQPILHINPEENKSIEESIGRFFKDFNNNGNLVEAKTTEKILRLSLGTLLLSKNAYVIPEYQGLTESVKILSNRNVRRANAIQKKVRTNELSDEHNSLELYSNYIKSISNDNLSHTELKYQHYRTGYYARRWCGSGTEKYLKIVEIKPTIVRKDLPQKQI